MTPTFENLVKTNNSRKKAENVCQRGRRKIGEQVIMDSERKHVFQERYQCYRGLKTISVLVEIILTLIDGITSHFHPLLDNIILRYINQLDPQN